MKSISRILAVTILCAALLLPAIGCGKKGPPRPPEKPGAAASDLPGGSRDPELANLQI
jgi:predicted small lipoprotein YifL